MSDQQVDISVILPILKEIPLFSSLDEKMHNEIISRITLMYYPADYELFKQGQQGDALYIIRSGQVEIYKEPHDEGDLPTVLATLGKNDFFGEMSLVSNAPRSASAKAISECQIFILKQQDFQSLLNSNSELATQVSSKMIDRLNENDKNRV